MKNKMENWIDVNHLLQPLGDMVLTYGIVNQEYDVKFYDGLSLNFDYWQKLPKPPVK